MEFIQNYKIHNRWDIEVVDSKTGKIKEKGVGFNVVTNGFIELLVNNNKADKNTLKKIAFGSGSGVPAISDTSLFTQIAYKEATTVETVFASPTSRIIKRITLASNEYVGQNITEVGFLGINVKTTGAEEFTLTTHALIQDAEGNPISIHKTNTDVVYITGTVYCTFSNSGFGDNGRYPEPANNKIIGQVFGSFGNSNNGTTNLRCGVFKDKTPEVPLCCSFSKAYTLLTGKIPNQSRFNNGIGVGNTANGTITYENMCFLETETPDQTVRIFGVEGFGYFSFPDSSILSNYDVSNQTIGTGDGVTTEFDFAASKIKQNSESVYVNDVLQVKGTDYYIDYESNCKDEFSSYHSAVLSVKDTPNQVHFGNMAECSPSSDSRNYYDPVAFYYQSGFTNTFPDHCTVSSDNPIWIDFLTPKECNTLKFVGNITVPSAKLDSIVIEYSNDNTNWSEITYTRTDQVYRWNLVTARYFRVYIQDYSWIVFTGTRSNSIDGIYTGGSFLLGKTTRMIKFNEAPSNDAIIKASYQLDIPYKTENNMLKMTLVVHFQRG